MIAVPSLICSIADSGSTTQIEDEAEPQQLPEHGVERGVDPDSGSVARFEVLVSGRFAAAPEKRDEEPAGDQRRDRHEEVRRKLPVIKHVCRRRQREECNRADRSADHRKPERPARNFTAAEKILLGAVVAFQEIDSHAGHAEQEHDDD